MSTCTFCLVFLLSSLTHLLSFGIVDDHLHLFINCGSSTSVDIDGRTFVSDIHPRQFHMSGDGSHTIENTNSSTEPLCQVARVFTEPSTYEFDIPRSVSTYILRFHFCDFVSSDPQLVDSHFSVSASGHMLLASFSPRKNVPHSSRLVKEFFLTVNTNIGNSKLRVHIDPSESLAFMNALEVLPTKQNITEVTSTHITSSGDIKPSNAPKSKVLETIYRINVGGPNHTDDSYGRTWISDDPYLINNETVRNTGPHSTGINYGVSGGATLDDAPKDVYSTAKQLNSAYTGPVNPTWQFKVSKDTTFFVRVHFCDISSTARGPYVFNFYVYNKFVREISPFQEFPQLTVPFYIDYMIDSDDNGNLNISIGPVDKAVGLNRTYAFLNGLEIMQVKNGTAPDPSDDKNGSRLGLVVGSSVAGLALVIILVVIVRLCRKKKKTKPVEIEALQWAMVPQHPRRSSHNLPSSHRSSSNQSNLSNLHLHLKIPFVEIQQMTRNFDENLIIGEGGFGKVYKGILKDERKVAVKRSNPDHGQGFPEFQAEIMVLSKIRHRHLVSLIGYCNENNEMILVYEFMEKGSLRDHLYGPNGSTVSSKLSWQQRLEICIGAAKGLDYLHTGLDSGIIHRDIKSTNILLNENYMAKVADFGLSRLGQTDESHVFTDVKGTYGYLDPEYIQCMQLTEKSDVYSFGVVLLEVLCARPVINNQENLAEWAMTHYKHEQVDKIIDPSLIEEINQNSLKTFIEAVEKCLKDNGGERPPMSYVCWDLEYALQLQKSAAQKETFQDDSMADASFSVPLPAVQRFQSQSYSEMDDELAVTITNTSTGEVFSQLKSDHGR